MHTVSRQRNPHGCHADKCRKEHGAKVAIADWDLKGGASLQKELGDDRAFFHQTDVSSWASVSSLFETVYKRWGVINVVISNAGVNTESFLSEEFDENGALLAPNTKLIDINLIGMVYVVKLATYYFNKWPQQRSILVLTGSAASFIDTPPLHLYCASKAGVLGLVRSLRTQLIKQVRVTIAIQQKLVLIPGILEYFHQHDCSLVHTHTHALTIIHGRLGYTPGKSALGSCTRATPTGMPAGREWPGLFHCWAFDRRL